MTDLLPPRGASRGRPQGSRPPARSSRQRPPRPAPRPSRLLKGISAAVVAALVGLLLVTALAMVIWIGEPRTSAPIGDVLRTAGAFWLLGHGARLGLPDGTVGLIPLGLSLLFAVLARRAGAKVARVRPAARRGRAIVGCAAAVAVPYAVAAALVATVVSSDAVRVTSASAALGGFVLAMLAAALGAARELPPTGTDTGLVRAATRGVVTATVALIAASALCAALMLVTHLSDAAALARPEKAGVVGGLGLLAIQLGLAPNVLAWSGSYLLGPGFSIGAGTVVSPTTVRLGDVPALPMLAGLPGSAAPWPLYVLFAVAPAAGVLAGLVALRRLPRTPDWPRAAGLGVAIAAAIGLLAAAAAALSGGSVASGRLETVGPSPLRIGAFAALEVGVPALLAVLGLVAYRRLWLPRAARAALADAQSDAGRTEAPAVDDGSDSVDDVPTTGRLRRWRRGAASALGGLVEPFRGRDDDTDDDTDTDDVIDLTDTVDVGDTGDVGDTVDLTDTTDLTDLTVLADAEPVAVVDLVKHTAGEGDAGPAGPDPEAAPGWDAELTQELDLSGLDAAVAERAQQSQPRTDTELPTDTEPPIDTEPDTADAPRRRRRFSLPGRRHR